MSSSLWLVSNVDAVRALYARWEQGDLGAGVALYDEDFTLVIDEGIPDGGIYEGPEGLRYYMARFLEPWDSLTMAGESFQDAHDNVLVKVRQTGTGKASGVPAELGYFHLWTFRDDRVTRLETIMDEQRALEAAGLMED